MRIHDERVRTLRVVRGRLEQGAFHLADRPLPAGGFDGWQRQLRRRGIEARQLARLSLGRPGIELGGPIGAREHLGRAGAPHQPNRVVEALEYLGRPARALHVNARDGMRHAVRDANVDREAIACPEEVLDVAIERGG